MWEEATKSSGVRLFDDDAGAGKRTANHGTKDIPTTAMATSAPSPGKKMSPEQNALMCGFVSFLAATTLACSCSGSTAGTATSSPSLLPSIDLTLDMQALASLVGGCVHFGAYYVTLQAYATASSTVITPLLQLSAVWMLPLSVAASLLGLQDDMITPMHLLSVLLIFVGGFLPAAEGRLDDLLTRSFWSQPAVVYCMAGELMVCVYNLSMHQCTFGSDDAADVGAALGHDGGSSTGGGTGSAVWRFFVFSRAANAMTCLLCFATVPSLRKQAAALLSGEVGVRYVLIALFGEVRHCSHFFAPPHTTPTPAPPQHPHHPLPTPPFTPPPPFHLTPC
jgi:hypothetical protein